MESVEWKWKCLAGYDKYEMLNVKQEKRNVEAF